MAFRESAALALSLFRADPTQVKLDVLRVYLDNGVTLADIELDPDEYADFPRRVIIADAKALLRARTPFSIRCLRRMIAKGRVTFEELGITPAELDKLVTTVA